MTVVLGIETATETASVGLYRTDGRYAEITRTCHRSLARDLMGMIDDLLTCERTAMDNVAAVAVSIGPGSFTGLRIGLATAKGLAAAAGIPVIPVPTPDTLAHRISTGDVPLYVLQRARKTEAYATRYDVQEGAWVRSEATTVLSTEDVSRLCAGNIIHTGNAAGIPAGSSQFRPAACSGSTVALLGAGQLQSGTFTPNDELEPEYVKPPDAKKAAVK